jgi:hypothetical protein
MTLQSQALQPSRVLHTSHQPKLATRFQTGCPPLFPRNEPRSGARSETETCSTLGDRLIFRAFLPSRVRCTQTGVYAVWGPVLSWVFNLFKGFPFIALGRCFHQPSSHRLGKGSGSRGSFSPRPVLQERRSAASQSVTER